MSEVEGRRFGQNNYFSKQKLHSFVGRILTTQTLSVMDKRREVAMQKKRKYVNVIYL